MIRLFLLLLSVTLASPVIAQTDAARDHVLARGRYDLRALPPQRRPATLSVPVRVPAAAAARGASLSLAVNGLVLVRMGIKDRARVTIAAPIQDRLLSVRNGVEVAVRLPPCPGGCPDALQGWSVGPATWRLGVPEAGTTDFSQLPTRYRAGLTVLADDARARTFADLVRAALAPLAPVRARADAAIVVSDRAPRGFTPAIRFDRGPVGLVRRDGAPVVPAVALRRLTVVQMLRGEGRPVIWVRPGAAMPSYLELDQGDVALFDGSRRLLAYSTLRDHRTIETVYGDAIDANARERNVRLWRWAMLALWIVATVLLIRLYRKLPPAMERRSA